MAKKIKSWVKWFTRTFQFPPDLFDFGPRDWQTREAAAGGTVYPFASASEALAHDFANVQRDIFGSAVKVYGHV